MNKSISNRLSKGAILLLAGFTLFGHLAYTSFARAHRQYRHLLESSNQLKKEISQKLELLDKINRNSSSIHIALLEYEAGAGQDQKTVTDSLQDHDITSVLKLNSLISDPEERLLFENFKQAQSEYSQNRYQYRLLKQRGVKTEELQHKFENVKKLFTDYSIKEQALADYQYVLISSIANKSTFHITGIGETITLIGVEFILILLVFAIVILRVYNRPTVQHSKFEEVLEEKEKAINRSASILNALPANIALLNNEGIIIEVNNSWKSFAEKNGFFGTNYGIGSDYSNCINDEEHKAQIASSIRHMLDGKVKMFSMIFPCHTPDKKRWFRVIATRKNENKNSGIVLMHLDITEQQEAEEKIRQSEANLRQIIDLVPHLIYVKDLNGFFALVNKRFAELFGIKSAELLNKRMSATTLAEQEEKFIAQDVEVIASAKTKIIPEAEFTDYSGKKHLIHLTKVPYTPAGTKDNAVLGVGIEITAQKKTEQALKKSEANLRSIFNNTDIAFILLDKSFTILSCNEMANRWAELAFGIRMQEGVNLLSRVSEERKKESVEGMSWIIAGNSIDEDTHYTLMDGSVEWYRVRMNPVRDNVGAVIGICLSATNVTAGKNTEIESNKLTEDLIQQNKDLEQFAYIVSHNLRSPVTNIIGISDILHSMEHNQEEEEQLKTALAISVEKLDHVIKDLSYVLQVKREVSEKNKLVCFSTLVRDIKLNIDSLIRKEQVFITCNFSEVDEMLTLKSYLYSIFYNLISNSIKYRQPNINPVIEIKSVQSENKIELIFKDNGLGIDLERRKDQVFGLYKRFHTHVEGKGMGLYMVKSQVETLGGKISILSELNRGTEFRIEFEN